MRSAKKLWIDYKKPTAKAWRKRGDFALLMLVTVQGLIISAPTEVLNPKESYWLGGILTVLVIAFKFWTNTHTEDENNPV